MGTATFYIVHPPDDRSPLAAVLRAYLSSDDCRALLGGCPAVTVACRHDSSFSARDVHARIRANPGPVLLLRPVQRGSVGDLQGRLQGRHVVLVRELFDADGLHAALVELKALHDAGEPTTALDVGVALLLMRKLDREHRWTGNSKGYMWADDLSNGKGVDIQYKSRMGLVVRLLTEAGYLVYKTSNGSRKYALNPEKRQDIYDVLRARAFPADANRKLAGNGGVMSARELDVLSDYDETDNGP